MTAPTVLAVWILIGVARAAFPIVPLAAQDPAAVRRTQEPEPAIVASDIARYLAALAADSVGGSAADSAAVAEMAARRLEAGARYVAEQFTELGLQPGLQAGSAWFQDYPLPGGRVFDYDASPLLIGTYVRKRGREVIDDEGNTVRRAVRLSMATAAPLVRGDIAEGSNGRYLGPSWGEFRRPTPVIVAGPHTAATASKIAVGGKVVFYVPPVERDSLLERQIIDTLARGSRGVVVVTAEDSARFAAHMAAVRRPLPVVDGYMKGLKAGPAWVVYVRPDSLAPLFALAGLDLAELRRAQTPITPEPLPLGAWFSAQSSGSQPGTPPTGANVIGFLEGSDSALKQQYVVVAAHLEPAGDSTRPEIPAAGRDASGVAGLLALARALAAPGARPRRSVIFAATSGVAHDFAGAEFLASLVASTPETPRRQNMVVANLTLDRISGRAGDSVAIDGLAEVDFGVPATWVTSTHAEAGLTVVGGSLADAPCADQCAFVRRKVPSLYLHDPHTGRDSARSSGVAAADPAHTARVARLAFDLVEAIANAKRPIGWRAGMLERLGRSGNGR